tara:strand:- start:4312 stop:4662 length:351 start_codon:yes stop_codon:yes gene_type:complete
MDKYINKECDSNIGLDLLANQDKINKIKQNAYINRINKDYNDVLDDFKNNMIDKIRRFDPLKKKDEYDTYIKNIWLHYLLGHKTKEEYIDLFTFLGVKKNIETDDKSRESDQSPDT